MKVDIKDGKQTRELSFVGVNFKGNCSLSKRYEDYLTKVSTNKRHMYHKNCLSKSTSKTTFVL